MEHGQELEKCGWTKSEKNILLEELSRLAVDLPPQVALHISSIVAARRWRAGFDGDKKGRL